MKSKKILAALLLAGVTLSGCVKNGDDTAKEDKSSVVEESSESASESSAGSLQAINLDHKISDEPRYGDTIKIGYSGDLCLGAQNIADLNGYFEENEIDVEFVNTKSGKDALGTGQIDALTGEFGGMLVPATKGLNYVFSTTSHSGCKSLYVLNDSDLNSTSDLVGENIAVTNGIGNSGHNALLRFLYKDGIDPNDVNVKPVDSAAVIQALKNEEIKGVILDDQFAQEFIKSGDIRPIRSLTEDDDFKREVCCVTAFNKDFVRENPQLAELVAAQIEKGNQYMAENPDESVDILLENNLASGDKETAVELTKAYDFSLDNEAGLETIRSYFDDYKELKLIDDSISTDDLIEDYWFPLGNGEVEIKK